MAWIPACAGMTRVESKNVVKDEPCQIRNGSRPENIRQEVTPLDHPAQSHQRSIENPEKQNEQRPFPVAVSHNEKGSK